MRRRRWWPLVLAVLAGPAIVGGYQAGKAWRRFETQRGSAEPRPLAGQTLAVTFLDVGQGDATVLQTPSGRTLLVDAGRADEQSSRGRTVVLPYLRRKGINALDALILTHWDQDHAGGADAVIGGVAVPKMLIPRIGKRQEPASLTEKQTMAAARRERVRIVAMARGQTIRVDDGVEISVLNPPARPHRFRRSPDNNCSIVLLVRYGDRRILLMGDAEEEAELMMLRNGVNPRADVLKVGHHGSGSSTSRRWLDAVRPTAAVISVGRRNAFGHPSRVVLDRLYRRRIRVYRTDRDGTILMTTDGRSIRTRSHLR